MRFRKRRDIRQDERLERTEALAVEHRRENADSLHVKGTCNDDHRELAASGHQLAEHVALAEPCTAAMKRDLRRVVCHAAARAEADRVGFRPLEVIEPELHVELARVVLDER